MDPLRLIPDNGGEVLIITTPLVLIGRDPICDIQLSDPSVSRQHAEIRLEDDRWLVRDLNSANGVMLDGKVVQRSPIGHGQRLQFGSVAFRTETDQGDEPDGATVTLSRPVVHARTRPQVEVESRATLVGSGRATKAPQGGTGGGAGRTFLVSLVGLALLAAGAGLWLRGQGSSTVGDAAPRSPEVTMTPPEGKTRVIPSAPATATDTAPAATATPVPATPEATPPPQPSPAVEVAPATAPRGVIMISTDARAIVLIDGQREGVLPAGGFRRVEVVPGEHVVSFEVGKERRDLVVRANANEQAVARFEIRSLRSAVPPPTSRQRTKAEPRAPAPTPVPRSAAVPATPIPLPAPSTPTPTPPPARATVPPPITDAGLAKGATATSRRDFYRALLLLNDAVQRLEKDSQPGTDLVIAHAYLAWTYQGLGRTAEAQNSARRALRLDAGIAARLGSFPAPVLDLFKPGR